ncbi:Cytochrome c oxidase subunit 4 [Roseovarius sp. THAF27]|nr:MULTISPECIES: aa3-type cytochrome c oxidase subunit IV [Roseovarius]MBY5987360.1 aa3-type cytochrome c oxidase subunit IV [Roseovarius atlanticus]MBY6126000.1 aa3-type cytochrome c oxidase subunit IV [Roseovarius atlanticus]MBY6149540.1 aa3-type cytochrome c oxidase subunit IV [Roseovarius atlanticus]QFT82858.1 Cytochrome c oxidase subunit 4 [Roseovarius sp. THAF27]QFT98111.1 Cytochrome c oxidase subunit 4 [Roseovarius sp. THAF8]
MANEHKHGEMDIKVQEKTFEGFLKASTYVAAGSIIFLILLAMINV